MWMRLYWDSDKYWSFFGYFESYELKIGFPYTETDIRIGLTHAVKKLKS